MPLRDSLAGRVLRGSGDVTYHLRECIGEGGQGWVFRANWDDPSGHVVIVKVLRPDVVGTETLKRFKREADVLRMLSTQGRPNPYIVRFYDHAVAQVPSPYGAEPLTLPFTVLEYVDGTTLEKVLSDQKGRGLPAERTRRLLRQISQALDIVHAQKVVHRDLKPSNILLATEAGTEIAKVTDFGLVKLVEMNLQRTAALAGASLGYAPPEQYEQGNQRVSPRTDVFSLAAVAFEMLSGKPAFPFNEGENPLLIVTRILNGPRPTLMRNRNALAPELESATTLIEALDRELTKALASDVNARHESVMEFWKAIEPPLRAASDDQRPPPRSKVNAYDVTARIQNSADHLPPAHQNGSGVQIRSSGGLLANAGSVAPPMQAGTPAHLRPTPAPPSPDRVSEAQAASPAAWQWTVLTTALAPNSIRGAVFRAAGDAAVAVSSTGLMRWERGAWMPASLPAHVPRASIRGLRWLADGSVLFFGENGLVGRIAPNGAASLWRVPDNEITFLGAHAEASGTTTLVGERPYRGAAARSVPGATAGVVAQFSGDRVTIVSDAINTTRLRGVTRLSSGVLVACGDWGVIVRIELGVVEHVGTICGGHLASISPLPDGGAVTVGVGGHALSLTPKLEAQLEAVQTTRDLLSLTTTEDGQAWAGSAVARLLRRTTAATPGWVRMSGDIGVTSSMIALWAGARSVRAIGDDGAVVEGRLA
ncbi:MAG: eukaryotic-like serine/threonine-protein kinase [Myxococcales bacterium]|nr:eukaryotic-like serine/threonine-protein kinase [Myxococcales bacterium]